MKNVFPSNLKCVITMAGLQFYGRTGVPFNQ